MIGSVSGDYHNGTRVIQLANDQERDLNIGLLFMIY